MRLEVRIARRYAKALADALKDEELERVLEEVRILSKFVDEKVVRYFSSPIVSVEKKKSLVEQILERIPVSKELRKVVLLMADKDRLGILKEFFSEFERFVDERLGVLRAEVTSATELDEETKDKIRAKVEEIFNKKVELTFRLDPSLIGGFVVRVADRIIDASIKTQLENLEKNLAG